MFEKSLQTVFESHNDFCVWMEAHNRIFKNEWFLALMPFANTESGPLMEVLELDLSTACCSYIILVFPEPGRGAGSAHV